MTDLIDLPKEAIAILEYAEKKGKVDPWDCQTFLSCEGYGHFTVPQIKKYFDLLDQAKKGRCIKSGHHRQFVTYDYHDQKPREVVSQHRKLENKKTGNTRSQCYLDMSKNAASFATSAKSQLMIAIEIVETNPVYAIQLIKNAIAEQEKIEDAIDYLNHIDLFDWEEQIDRVFGKVKAS